MHIVDMHRLRLDVDILLQVEMFPDEPLELHLGLGQRAPQTAHVGLQLGHLVDETVLDGVAAQLHVGAVGARVEARGGERNGSGFVADGLVQLVDVIFHIADLTQYLDRIERRDKLL